MNLEHFIYSLHGKYDVTAKSPGLDSDECRTFSEPGILDPDEFDIWQRVWTLRRFGERVVLSFFPGIVQDAAERKGIYSHNIVIDSKDYLRIGGSPLPFTGLFITDLERTGELPPIFVSTDNLQVKQDTDSLKAADFLTIERILTLILKGDSFTLSCSGRSPEQLLNIIASLISLLPSSERIVPFATASPSRRFTSAKKDALRIALTSNRSLAERFGQESIDIDDHSKSQTATTPEAKAAHYLVDEFSRSGIEGLKRLHEMWERRGTMVSPTVSVSSTFVDAYEVKRGIVTAASVEEIRKKGQIQTAKRQARAVIQEHGWSNLQELTALCILLLDEKSPQLAKSDIALLISETSVLEPSEKFGLYEALIANRPKIADAILSELKKYYGTSLLTQMRDLSKSPALSSLLIGKSRYPEFESMSKQILRASVSEANTFESSLIGILDMARKQFANQTLDLIQTLLNDFGEHKNTILLQIQKEDLVPSSIASRLPRDSRQLLLGNVERFLQILKQVIVP